jgi:MATE family multidrug resistance protein
MIDLVFVFFSGKQKRSAMISFGGFYLFGLPIAALLMFYVRIDIYGFWIGIIAAETVTNALLFTLVQRFNWERHAQAALIRINFNPKNATTNIAIVSIPNEKSNEIEKDLSIPTEEYKWRKSIGIKVLILLLFVCFLITGIITSILIPL